MVENDRESIRRMIRAKGFDVVRFASADLVQAVHRERFLTWLKAGWQANMDWLARDPERRLNPQRVLPGALSVVVCGVNTWVADTPTTKGDPARPLIARYARYRDYHEGMTKALREAGDALASHLGLSPDDHRSYVDTGPVMERGWAVRAGLGFQGKNGMLISRGHGNWLLLGVILVRYAFPPDEGMEGVNGDFVRRDPSPAPPAGELCGTCTRCLTACPTRAIPEPGLVDARRCLSFHTIENRGSIPVELRRPMGRRLFGCDECLEVCPWNRFAQAARSQLLEYRPEIMRMRVVDFLRLNREQYTETFRRSPLKRPKLEGLLRNAAVVAGNVLREGTSATEQAELISALQDLLRHENDIVREHAAWALHEAEC